MASSPLGTIIGLVRRVLSSVFGGETWATWQIVLKAAHALPLTDDERAIVKQFTQRDVLPTSPVRPT